MVVDFTDYTPIEFKSDDQLMSYYKPNTRGLFNLLYLNKNYSGKLTKSPNKTWYYYSALSNTLTEVPSDGLVLATNVVSTIKPYLTKGTNNLTVIGNPLYQFHLVCDANGNPTDDCYYVEMLTSSQITAFNE